MVQLHPSDVQRKEILQWKGVRLFTNTQSSSAQKIRMVLELKDVTYTTHEIDIMLNEHLTPEYIGVNPRGLLPTLVDDGQVHIESDDIAIHLEQRFPEHPLVPAGKLAEARAMLHEQDDRHYDLRKLSFRWVFNVVGAPKSDDDLQGWMAHGTGTVRGQADHQREKETAFWRKWGQQGCTDEEARESAARFQTIFTRLDTTLAHQPYLLGDSLSLPDLGWIVNIQRLFLGGWPLAALTPHLAEWRRRMVDIPVVAKHLALPPPLAAHLVAWQEEWDRTGQSMAAVCFPEVA